MQYQPDSGVCHQCSDIGAVYNNITASLTVQQIMPLQLVSVQQTGHSADVRRYGANFTIDVSNDDSTIA